MSSDEGQHPSTQTQDSASADPTTSAQQQAALRMVQTIVTESVKSAVVGLSQELLAVLDQRLTAHQGMSQSSIPLSPKNGAFTPVSSGDSISLPSGGLVPKSGALQSMSVASMAMSGATQLSAASSIMSSLSAIPDPSNSGLTLTPSTPLSSLLPPPANPLSSGAVSVRSHSPPIPLAGPHVREG